MSSRQFASQTGTVMAVGRSLFMDSLARLIGSDASFGVVCRTVDPEQLAWALEEFNPDILILDADALHDDLTNLCAATRQARPTVTILLAAEAVSRSLIRTATQIGGCKAIGKTAPVAEVLQFIQDSIRRPTPRVDGARSAAHGNHDETEPSHRSRTPALTPREHQVLRLVAGGLTKKDIADELGISVKTAENHATNLMRKLEVHDRVGLTLYAIREGLVTP